MTAVHFVVPDSIDDPARPSGGNAYDRRVCLGLSSLGWSVHEHPVPGSWPRPDAESLIRLGHVLEQIPDDAIVLLDGLIASTAPEALVPEARRLRLVVLVHMPLGHRPADHVARDIVERERAVLSAASAVVTTSAWARHRVLELYQLRAERVHVAQPGVDHADLAAGTEEGGQLLCVAAVTFDKGHDVLLDALETVSDLSWHCVCVGRLDRDPAFVQALRRRAAVAGLGERVEFLGPRTGADLDRTYAAADLLVLPSRAETYGMVVTEALARGVPVVASEVGGLTEAIGHGRDGIRPGLLAPPGNSASLRAALRAWLGNAALRQRLRQAARERRASLSEWPTTASCVAHVLARTAR
jgi:glycosyltransferase involved in cell wall biosynthesis